MQLPPNGLDYEHSMSGTKTTLARSAAFKLRLSGTTSRFTSVACSISVLKSTANLLPICANTKDVWCLTGITSVTSMALPPCSLNKDLVHRSPRHQNFLTPFPSYQAALESSRMPRRHTHNQCFSRAWMNPNVLLHGFNSHLPNGHHLGINCTKTWDNDLFVVFSKVYMDILCLGYIGRSTIPKLVWTLVFSAFLDRNVYIFIILCRSS